MPTPSAPELGSEERRFFALSLDMFCLASVEGHFLRVNPAFVDALGWPERELLSRSYLDFVHPDDVEATVAEVARLAAGHHTIDFANRYLCADGSWRWLGWRASADPETGIIYAAARDVTGLRAAQEATERARRAADEANRSKSAFLANMSHELRTPLNAILGFSEILREDFQGEADLGSARAREVVADLDKVRSAGRHLLELVNQVLDLSKVEAGRMDLRLEQFPVSVVVEEAVAVARPLCLGNGNQLIVAVLPGTGSIVSDATKVRQVLLNLLSNAVRFTEHGEIRLVVHAEADDRFVRFEVRDTGIGFDAATLERLFEPFAQGDSSATRKYGGTGLGLAISRRYCELLGGEIGAFAAPGVGASFWFRLPRGELST